MVKRLGNVTAAVALGLLLSGTAVKADDIKSMTTTADLNIRSGAGTQYSVLGSYKKNTSIQVISIENGWAKISYNGRTAYCSASYLKDTTTAKTMKTTANLNVRTGPGTKYDILGSFKEGTTISVKSISNGWAKISFNGKTGYCSAEYLQEVSDASNSSGSSSNSEGNSSNKTTTMITTANLNVRSGAGTNYSVIGSYTKGTKVKVLSIKSGWAKVSYNGKTGYCSAEYLKKVSSEEKVEETCKIMEVTTYLNVRKGPSTSHEKIGMLDPKDKVKVISISNGWAKISYKNQTAYVSSSYLKEIASEPQEEISYKIMKSTTYLNVRSGKSVTSNKVGLLSPDEKVKVISISDGWAKIYYQDGTAYCSSSYLAELQDSETSEAPNESDKTDSNNNTYNFHNKELNFTLDSFIEGQLTKDNASSKGEAINKASLNKYINTDLIVERGNTFQFLKVNKFRNNMNVEELNSYLNSLKYDTFHNQGQAFINAAREYNIDPLYLVAHTLLETGYGKSELARGVDYEVTVSAEDGQQGETKVVRVYNLFGIGAYDSDPLGGGAETAYKNGWTSIELAIKGGAEWIANNYVHSSRTGQHQYTVYMMRWNTNNYTSSTNNVIWHQYATDITWAESISSLMNKLSYMYENAVLDLEIPVFLTE